MVGAFFQAFAFGLIHGFGFANALAELGLKAGSIAAPLAGFNIGVELGQLAGRTYLGQTFGDEEVAGVAGADVGDRPLSPETGDLLKKDDVH